MANPGQLTVGLDATGDVVQRAQRALRRTPNLLVLVDGTFSAQTEQAVKDFQAIAGLPVDGIVGPSTWDALPTGGAMPTVRAGDTGDVVRDLQATLTFGAPGQWPLAPNAIDGTFGPDTEASVRAFQEWGQLPVTGVVDDLTWSAALHAAGATLESAVGLRYVID
jgi:peptidoglycan hydrolase-like protein with peptidoglycan-binding domain